MLKTTKAKTDRGAWVLEDCANPIWQIPEGVDEVRFNFNLNSYGALTSLKGVVMDSEGNIYGERTLTDLKQSGYCMFGRVSVGGKKQRAFTSNQIFESNGRLVSVAILHI